VSWIGSVGERGWAGGGADGVGYQPQITAVRVRNIALRYDDPVVGTVGISRRGESEPPQLGNVGGSKPPAQYAPASGVKLRYAGGDIAVVHESRVRKLHFRLEHRESALDGLIVPSARAIIDQLCKLQKKQRTTSFLQRLKNELLCCPHHLHFHLLPTVQITPNRHRKELD